MFTTSKFYLEYSQPQALRFLKAFFSYFLKTSIWLIFSLYLILKINNYLFKKVVYHRKARFYNTFKTLYNNIFFRPKEYCKLVSSMKYLIDSLIIPNLYTIQSLQNKPRYLLSKACFFDLFFK